MVAKSTKPKQKTRTGCRTCKVRKVKCDETFPICKRCLSTGRHCDGYGIWGGGSNHQQTHTAAQKGHASCVHLVPISRESFRITVSPDEQRSLNWFENRTAIKLPGAFRSAFWGRTLFQASTTEPAILHAVVALSSTHMRASLDTSDSPPSKILTLQQYIAAMECLQPHSGRPLKEKVCITLIACLVFTYLELLQSHYQAALLHLDHGLNLITYCHHVSGRTTNPQDFSFGEHTNDMFGRLYVQARLFDQNLQSCWNPSRGVTDSITVKKLTSNNEARQCLDVIFFDIISLRDAFQKLMPVPGMRTYSSIQERQLGLIDRLSSWRKAYNPVFHSDTDRPVQLEYFAQKLLHLYYTMATIMVTASISNDECIYDDCTTLFVSMIEQCIQIHKLAFSKKPASKFGVALRHDPRAHNKLADSVVDIGCVAPLYFVAMKCRHWRIRSRAVRLLRSAPHKEGILDSHLAATVAEKIIELEGQSITAADNSSLLDLTGFSNFKEKHSTLNTVHRVKIHLPENADGILTLLCYYKNGNDDAYSSIYAFDLLTQTWSCQI